MTDHMSHGIWMFIGIICESHETPRVVVKQLASLRRVQAFQTPTKIDEVRHLSVLPSVVAHTRICYPGVKRLMQLSISLGDKPCLCADSPVDHVKFMLVTDGTGEEVVNREA